MIGKIKVKTVSSTSDVDFRNTSNGYYDMIIMIQNTLVSQTINITDVEGNLITEQPMILTNSGKIIIKDIKIGSISFSDTNSYNIIISYIIKSEPSGIPYIDIDYSTGNISVADSALSLKSVSSSFVNSILYSLPVPSGKIWKIRSIAMEYKASVTQTNYWEISIIPPTALADYNSVYALLLPTIDATEGDIYSLLLSTSSPDQSSSKLVNTTYQSRYILYKEIEVNSNYSVYMESGEPTNNTDFTIEYEEVNTI